MAILDSWFGLLPKDAERGRFRRESQQEGRNRVNPGLIEQTEAWIVAALERDVPFLYNQTRPC